jgi:hypothetical protein
VAVLWQLAQASTAAAPDASARLALKAMSAAGRAPADNPAFDKPAALRRLRATLASPPLARANFAELAYGAGVLPGYLTEPGTPAREQLLREWDRALLRQVADGSLARLDRIAATDARVSLARVDAPKAALPLPLLTEVRAVTYRAVRESTDRYEREAVVFASSQLLAEAGLLDESDALLDAELKRSATPYYLMLGLAANARTRGDTVAALAWYEQAYAGAQGPATRLQWGAAYVRALVELAPADDARIEHAAGSVIGELEPRPETFHARNTAVLNRMGTRLNEWNKDGSHGAALGRIRQRLSTVCVKLPAGAPERATCSGALAEPSARAGEPERDSGRNGSGRHADAVAEHLPVRRRDDRPRHRPAAGAAEPAEPLRGLRHRRARVPAPGRGGQRADRPTGRPRLHLGRGAGRDRPPRAGAAHRQPGDRGDHRGGCLARQGHPLPDAPGQHRLPDRGAHRRLRARQQPCARLGPRRAGRDAAHAARRGYPHRRRRRQRG